MQQKIHKIIENSVNRSKKQQKEYLLFGRVFIYIQDPIISDMVDFELIIEQIEEFVPSHLFDGIDLIYVGQFLDLIERELEALYESGAIYITNILNNNLDYVENIIHEAGHSLEQNSGLQIYGDKKIEREFLGKRQRLFYKIQAENYNISNLNYLDTEFQEDIDNFLYREIGYENLNYLINGLFLNPYAATSLSEYFSSGLEKYLLDGEDRRYLKILSPKLVEKIEELINGY
tara:strand:+ start:3190 stop:3885 length:696 start_codon:yes stop_codon:yes gene_type:complete